MSETPARVGMVPSEAQLDYAARVARNWYAKKRRLVPICLDAEDLEQEARIALWEKRERYDPELGRPATFINFQAQGAAQRACRRYSYLDSRTYQKNSGLPFDQRVQEPLPLDFKMSHHDDDFSPGAVIPDLNPGPELLTERGHEVTALWDAVAKLGAKAAQILLLRFVEELPQREVAKRLGVNQMFVSRTERSALQELRSCLLAESDSANGRRR